MKKKNPQVKFSKQKLIFITSLIVAIGIFILFLSILFAPDTYTILKTESSLVDKKNNPIEYPTQTKITEPKTTKSVMPTPALYKTTSVPIMPIETAPILPPAKAKTGKLIFVFDDGGNNALQALPFLELPFPITIAVMPELADSVKTARLVRKAKKELFLHQPMQAVNLSSNPGPGAILPHMTIEEASQILKKNIATIGPIDGINNHEGSLITTDRNLIGAVLDVCVDKGLMFLDSRTTAETVVPIAARERNMSIWERNIFLDNSQNETEIREMLQKGLDIADKEGYVIMIGHVWSPGLPAILLDVYPTLRAQGYTFTTLSKLN